MSTKRRCRPSLVQHDFGASESAYLCGHDGQSTYDVDAKSNHCGAPQDFERQFTPMNDALVVPHDDIEVDEEESCQESEFNLVFVKSAKKGVQFKRLDGSGNLHDGLIRKIEKFISECVAAEGMCSSTIIGAGTHCLSLAVQHESADRRTSQLSHRSCPLR